MNNDFIMLPSSPVVDSLVGNGRSAVDGIETKIIRPNDFNNLEKPVTYLEMKNTANGISLEFSKPFERSLIESPNADKLLIQALNGAYLNSFKSKVVDIPVSEIIDARGVTNRSELTKALKDAIAILTSIEIWYKCGEVSFDAPLISSASYNASRWHEAIVTIEFSEKFLDHISNCTSFAKYPAQLLKIPNNKTNAYIFCKCFVLQQRRNLNKQGENTLTVKNLLSHSTLPIYENLSNKKYTQQRIIKPFIDALDYLESSDILKYHFKRNKGERLTDEELNRLKTEYRFFINCSVVVDWVVKADYSKVREKKIKREEREANKPTPQKTKQGKKTTAQEKKPKPKQKTDVFHPKNF